MGWFDYYRLLEKYDGKLENATLEELDAAKRANPITPEAALDLAWKKWHRRQVTITGDSNDMNQHMRHTFPDEINMIVLASELSEGEVCGYDVVENSVPLRSKEEAEVLADEINHRWGSHTGLLEACREAERAVRSMPGNWPAGLHTMLTEAIARASRLDGFKG